MWQLCSEFFAEPPYCFPQWLFQHTFLNSSHSATLSESEETKALACKQCKWLNQPLFSEALWSEDTVFQRKSEGPCVNLLLPDSAMSSYSDSQHDYEFKDMSVLTQGQLVFSAPWTNSDGLGRWGKQTLQRFSINEVSNRGPQRFMRRVILTTLKNGTAWAGEIGEGRLDSRCRQKI